MKQFEEVNPSDDDQDSLSVHLILRGEDDDVEFRTLGLGVNPMILIEPVEEANGDVNFNVDVTGLDQEETAVVLESIVDILRRGEEK